MGGPVTRWKRRMNCAAQYDDPAKILALQKLGELAVTSTARIMEALR